jgi:endonuclease/exonuclease/phosphatase family metal-dependent hydrolase
MRRFLYYFFATCTWLLVIVYLTSCFTPIISPAKFSLMPVLALGFPYLAACMVLFIVLWIFIKRNYCFFLLITLLSGFVNLQRTFALSLPIQEKVNDSNTIRVLSWNVQSFGRPDKWLDTPGNARRRMLDYLQKSNADIICLQEMIEYAGDAYNSNNLALQQFGYKYIYTPSDVVAAQPWGQVSSGSGIYSKYPIINTDTISLGDPSLPELVVYADIMVKGKTIRVSTCHFKSINIFGKSAGQSVATPFHGDTSFIYNQPPHKKLVVFGIEHSQQAVIAKKFISNSTHPLIFTADMNSVPTSHAYDIMVNGMQDAFVKKGNGLGGSLDSLPKTLRIDYMFADRSFRIKNYHQDRLALSDHFPHYMDIELKR